VAQELDRHLTGGSEAVQVPFPGAAGAGCSSGDTWWYFSYLQGWLWPCLG
jgi:hypothetical protein